MHLESPGKLSAKPPMGGGGYFMEKELAHDSHLIQHSEQPISQFSRQDIDVFKNQGQRPRYNENAKSHWQQEASFDMEFGMPPDITSIDSDINKIGALTPSPLIGDVFDAPFTAHTIGGTHVTGSKPQGPPNKFGQTPQSISNAIRRSDSMGGMYEGERMPNQ